MPAETIYLKDYQKPQFEIESLNLEFDLFDDHALVTSTQAIHCLGESRTLCLDGDELECVDVLLDGESLPKEAYQVSPTSLTLSDLPQSFTLTVVTRIKPQSNTQLSGLYRSHDLFCTQCEAEGFRRITYFLDRPDVMTVYTTKIIADKQRFPILLSNGNPIASGELEDGRHFAVWHDPFKKPSYLFALVAGNLAVVKDIFTTQSGRDIDLRIYVEPGNEDKCSHAMESLKKSMRWDEECYGREYDLDIFMIVAVSDFNMGAMENKGLNIFNSKYILARPDTATDMDYAGIEGVVAHEYFHNWTGNRITCRDWFQLSLKEGLTVYRDQEFSRDMNSRDVNRIQDVKVLRNAQFPEDAGPMAHPVRPESYIEINNFYTATVYNKGAEVIRMQHSLLGDEGFHKGMDLYFERHDGQAVTIDDFVACMSDASGKDLTQFKRWYSQAGTPEVDVKVSYDRHEQQLTLDFKQSCRPTPESQTKKPYHIPIKMALFDKEGNKHDVDGLFELKEAEQQLVLEGIEDEPVVSFLRDFSAPVKLNCDYSDAQLQHLMKYEDNGFACWEASQRLALKYILNLMVENDTDALPDELFDVYLHIIQDEAMDNALRAEILTPPSFEDIASHCEIVDVDRVHQARRAFIHAIGTVLLEEIEALYHQVLSDSEGGMTAAAYGARKVKAVCLMFIAEANPKLGVDLSYAQFAKATTMTDEINGLSLLMHQQSDESDHAVQQFFDKWQADELVMDKWFSAQAMSRLPNTLEKVKSLLEHPSFSLKNPNKVRALIGVFCYSNPVNFHRLDGEGYRFLTDILQELDKINPQVSSRMVVPLTRWQRYDEKRQSLMKAQLQRLADNKALSKDLYEMVSKSL